MAAVVELQLRIDAVEQQLASARATLQKIVDRTTCSDSCANTLHDMAREELGLT